MKCANEGRPLKGPDYVNSDRFRAQITAETPLRFVEGSWRSPRPRYVLSKGPGVRRVVGGSSIDHAADDRVLLTECHTL